jgi:hypothetical protein
MGSGGLQACLWISTVMLVATLLISFGLPRLKAPEPAGG